MDEKIKEERNKAYDEMVRKGYITDLDSAFAFKLGFDEAVRILKNSKEFNNQSLKEVTDLINSIIPKDFRI